MLRNLVDEVRNRRVLAFAALGVLVALAVPLLFLKGAPDGAPAANSAAPAAPAEAKLPARAARLLATSDPGAPGGRAKGSATDPFAPPASYRAAAKAATGGTTGSASSGGTSSVAGGSTATSTTQTNPIPAIVQNGSSKKKSPNSNSSTSSNGTPSIAVDIRYGAKKDSKIRRSIPRYQTFYIHGKLVAVFVKYSASKKKAVFAVAPGLHISGPTNCRVEDGVCKYLDIKAGSYARISMVTESKAVVSRRLDVVHTKARAAGTMKATAASGRNEAACLVGKLVAMKPGDKLVDRDACES